MDWSFGEVQSLVAKAARGSGRSFGIADEAGHAARWLSERGFDGAGALAALLKATDGIAPGALSPDSVTLGAQGDTICPLVLGTYLADTGTLPTEAVGPVLYPLILLPFAAHLSALVGPVRVQFGEVEIFELDGASAFGPVCAGPGVADVRLQRARPSAEPMVRHGRATVSDTAVAVLQALAQRTYAPATEESRAKGAGAGLTDSD